MRWSDAKIERKIISEIIPKVGLFLPILIKIKKPQRSSIKIGNTKMKTTQK
jgi:hypothetical protein